VVGKSSESSQLLVEFLLLSCFDRCLIIHQFPSPGTFSTRPTGEQQKKPLKISVASDTVKGPDIRLAATSTASSWSIILGHIFAEGRFKGRKDMESSGGVAYRRAISDVVDKVWKE